MERTEYKDVVVEQPPRLLRLAQVAAMLQVHPKTVYYWVRTGRLNALTSPGGLLRVRAEDARALCQSAGMPIPAELATVKRRVHVVESDKTVARALVRNLKAKGFDVRTYEDPYEALIATAKEPPELFIVDVRAPGIEANRAIAALRRDDTLKRTRVIVWSDLEEEESAQMLEAGVEAVIPRGDASALAKALK
ncbi:MAG: response regulator [Polyangiales bacterium]